jgi:hypothetical protein
MSVKDLTIPEQGQTLSLAQILSKPTTTLGFSQRNMVELAVCIVYLSRVWAANNLTRVGETEEKLETRKDFILYVTIVDRGG